MKNESSKQHCYILVYNIAVVLYDSAPFIMYIYSKSARVIFFLQANAWVYIDSRELGLVTDKKVTIPLYIIS